MTASEIASKFNLKGKVEQLEPISTGHINDTYKVTCSGGRQYLLQKINHYVFKYVDVLINNIDTVTNYLRSQQSKGLYPKEMQVLRLIDTKENTLYYHAADDSYWRVYDFVNAKSFDIASTPEQAILGGKAFGLFSASLANIEMSGIGETIKKFHDIDFRLDNLKTAIKKNPKNRKAEVQEEIDYVLSISDEMHSIKWAGEKGEIPKRVLHNDTKYNNLLFNEQNEPISIVDLDTIMPGYIHYDFGDAVRTMASTLEEDDPNYEDVTINMEMFKAFSKGFLSELKDTLNAKEISLLPNAIAFMAYIMGTRFLTDYIEGDIYYKIKRPSHNLDRCRNQLHFVKEVLRVKANLANYIRECLKPEHSL